MALPVDDETLKLFVEESLDNLSGIENDLLAIEEAGADIDVDLVNKVFRAVHSIKGGAGFLGLVSVKELSDAMENILNLIRQKELVPTPEIISVILQGTDQLNEMINDPATSNDSDIGGLVAELAEVLNPSPPGEEQPESDSVSIKDPEGNPLFSFAADQWANALKGGKIIYLFAFDLAEDIKAAGSSTENVLAEIDGAGEVLASEEKGNIFFVLFASVLEPYYLDSLTKLSFDKIFRITDDYQTVTCSEDDSGAETSADKSAASTDKQVQEKEPGKEPEEKPSTALSDKPAAGAPVSRPQKTVKKPVAARASVKKASDSFLRVNVGLLDKLMTLAGELVLTRNQLVQNVTVNDMPSIEVATQRLNHITGEVQEAVMTTRMQPIGTVFNKFHRVVRDMSRDLGKEINLLLEGEDVDLDKTIIEAITDPLTHLVRNSVDHGLETPEERKRAGKNPAGSLKLSASHEAGQVNIEIIDDGRGIDHNKVKEKALKTGLVDQAKLDAMPREELVRLIFRPGFSTAEKVTDVSGRGVGMDVVQTNLAKLSGDIDVQTEIGAGTTIRMKLPLTLAIIPSLIITVEKERYAIPQVNLVELVRVPPGEVRNRIERIGNAEVIRLREALLPLVSLADVIGIDARTYEDPLTSERSDDRRKRIVDRRLPDTDESASEAKDRDKRDRRRRAYSSYNIAVVSAGDVHFGLIVDEFLDSEEIVVKPLGRHFKHCKTYAGATIRGDGRAALILDIPSICKVANMSFVREDEKTNNVVSLAEKRNDAQSLLIVENAPGVQFALSLGIISRVEKVPRDAIELLGNKKSMKYRGGTLPICAITDAAEVKPCDDREYLHIIVCQIGGAEIGLMISQIVDVADVEANFDEQALRQPGILGSAIILDKTTMLLDVYEIVQCVFPDLISAAKKKYEGDLAEKATLLVVEDSAFFRNHICSFLEEEGYDVIDAEDGLKGFEALEEHAEEIALVLTDIEMPNLDGLGLAKKIRADSRFTGLPIIAVTSVAGEAAAEKGFAAGINDYLVKLDRGQILEKLAQYLSKAG